jgi:hypothetical protein
MQGLAGGLHASSGSEQGGKGDARVAPVVSIFHDGRVAGDIEGDEPGTLLRRRICVAVADCLHACVRAPMRHSQPAPLT